MTRESDETESCERGGFSTARLAGQLCITMPHRSPPHAHLGFLLGDLPLRKISTITRLHHACTLVLMDLGEEDVCVCLRSAPLSFPHTADCVHYYTASFTACAGLLLRVIRRSVYRELIQLSKSAFVCTADVFTARKRLHARTPSAPVKRKKHISSKPPPPPRRLFGPAPFS
jgi:hypothetical protein